MANRGTITYNGKTISTEDRDGSFAVTYNGSTIATVGAGASKTLNCSGKVMKANVVVGGKTLNCSGKIMATNVVVSVASLVDSVLANNSWATISAISRAGQASQYWKVGDTKTFTCNGTTYTAQIIGFDHDNVSDSASYGRTKAGITFQFKEVYTTTYKFHTSSSSTVYSNTAMYKTYLPAIQGKLESELSSVLVGVNKVSRRYSGSSETLTGQKLALPAAVEIFGNVSDLASIEKNEGTQYSFYAAGNSKKKTKSGSTAGAEWWTRTIYDGFDDLARVVNGSGSLYYGSYSQAYWTAPIFFV